MQCPAALLKASRFHLKHIPFVYRYQVGSSGVKNDQGKSTTNRIHPRSPARNYRSYSLLSWHFPAHTFRVCVNDLLLTNASILAASISDMPEEVINDTALKPEAVETGTSTEKEASLSQRQIHSSRKFDLLQEIRRLKESPQPSSTPTSPEGSDLSSAPPKWFLYNSEMESSIARFHEAASLFRLGDPIKILLFMKSNDLPEIAENYERASWKSANGQLRNYDPEYDDGGINAFLKGEIIETCAHLLARGIRVKSASSDLLRELGDLLSDPELQELVKIYGALFVSNLNTDILRSMPEVDRFESAPIAASIFGDEERVLEFLREETKREIDRPADIFSRLIEASASGMEEASRIIERRMQEAVSGARSDGEDGSRMSILTGIGEASSRLKANAEKKLRVARLRRLFRISLTAIAAYAGAVLLGANTQFQALIPCVAAAGIWIIEPAPKRKNSGRRSRGTASRLRRR